MNSPTLQAQWENELRKKLQTLRDEAMELAAALEFTGYSEETTHPLWQFATETIAKTEYFIANPKGELDYPDDREAVRS